MARSEEIEIAVVPKSHLEAIQQKLDNLNENLEDFRRNWQPKEPTEYLSKKETIDLLGITISTLDRWTEKEYLKRYSIGNRIFYKRAEIEAAMQQI